MPAAQNPGLKPLPTEPSPVQQTLSLVIPLLNEEENVGELTARIHRALARQEAAWELILVDDGSIDGTARAVREAATGYGAHVRLVQLQRNFGQTAAMQAGIDAARGDIIVTLDGDLQNEPGEIPRMVERLVREDLDILVGWRKDRRDRPLRTALSKIANRLIGRVTGIRLHDYGCSLKVYRAGTIKNVRLYGEMHRFIPAWAALQTLPSRIKEEPVVHHPRRRGVSKYGFSRTVRVIVDLLVVYFFMRFRNRPGHFFGVIGLVVGAVGGVLLTYLVYIKLFLGAAIGGRPLLMLAILLLVMSVQFLTTGMLAELLSRIYFETGENQSYAIRNQSEVRDVAEGAWKRPDEPRGQG